LNSVARNGEADCGHHDGQANRAQEVMHPAEPGIETEEETQHWRIPFAPTAHKLLSER
jgi:hypothetical protein